MNNINNTPPLEMTSVRQWIGVGRNADGTGKVAKMCHADFNLRGYQDNEEKDVWENYDFVMAQAGTMQHLIGAGFVLTPDAGFVVFDLDNPKKIYDERIAKGSTPEEATTYANAAWHTQQQLLEVFSDAYIERSQSGSGYHIVMRGNLPEGAFKVTNGMKDIGVEIYHARQFILMTGQRVNQNYNLDGHQGAINEFVYHVWDKWGKTNSHGLQHGAYALNGCEEHGRRLDLSDEQVIEKLHGPIREIYENKRQSFQGGDWSQGTPQLIGELDKITGDVDQVQRVYFNSPRMVQAGDDAQGRSRMDKSLRRFDLELAKARQSNFEQWEKDAPKRAFKEYHEKLIADGVWLGVNDPCSLAYQQAQTQREAEEMNQRNQQIYAETATGQTVRPKLAPEVLQLVRMIRETCPGADPSLSLPDGMLGSLIGHSLKMTKRGHPDYSIPAVLAFLSHTFGRRYRVQNKSLNLFIFGAGPSGSGKSRTTENLLTAIEEAHHNNICSIADDPFSPSTIIQNQTPDAHATMKQKLAHRSYYSGAGMQMKVMEENHGRMFWAPDEGTGFIKVIFGAQEKRSVMQEELHTHLKTAFDQNGKPTPLEAPKSLTGMKEKRNAEIYCPSLTMYTQGTQKQLTTLGHEAKDGGMMSRFILIYQTHVPEPEMRTLTQQKTPLFNAEQAQFVQRICQYAKDLDAQFVAGPDDAPVNATTVRKIMKDNIVDIGIANDAFEWWAKLDYVFQQISVMSTKGEINEWFQTTSRTSELLFRIAGIYAVCDNEHAPFIQLKHIQWAANVTLHWTCNLLNEICEGNIGITLQDADKRALSRVVGMCDAGREGVIHTRNTTSITYNKAQREGMIPLNVFIDKQAQVEFSAGDSTLNNLRQSRDHVHSIIARFVEEDLISIVDIPMSAGSTRGTKFIVINEQHSYWKQHRKNMFST